MAGSDQLQIVDFQPQDVEAGLALSGEAGWNQTGEDWRHFIENGRTIGVRTGAGAIVASAAALPYEGPFGFIGMVLVTRHFRRQGIATRLVERCVAELCGRGLTPVLDATAAGAEVYKQQGFLPQFGFDRWEGTVQGAASKDQEAERPQQPERLVAIDHEAFGASRAGLLGDFLSRNGTYAEVSGAGDGFAMVRHGRRALQAGPVVASSEAAALDLLERLLARVSGLVFVDVPSIWRGIAASLAARGFVVQRSFTRMGLHRAEPFGNPESLFAVAGPEFG